MNISIIELVVGTYGTISSLILLANFPTLVPPYFCTIQVADGSLEFWCQFGGVAGEGVSGSEEVDDDGRDGDAETERSDMSRFKTGERGEKYESFPSF